MNLIFKGKLKDTGEIIEQRIPIKNPGFLQDPEKAALEVRDALVQLGVGGMVHQTGSLLTLIPGARFETISCEIPNIMLADPRDIPPLG
jgi:hypothetical protein